MDYKEISKLLIEMGLEDQRMRVGFQDPRSAVKFDSKIDRRNTEKLKHIIAKIGWPTISKVGEEASYAAWLITQHADHDIYFQEKCLELMLQEKDDVLLSNLAYLTDRAAVNKGKLQVYGTQFYKNRRGNIIPRPIKNPNMLDKRRQQMGLESFSKYEQKMKGEYTWKKGYKNPIVGRFYKSL